MAASTKSATAIGAIAVLLWACLAALTSLSRDIPTFEALTIIFAVATLVATPCLVMLRGWRGFLAGLKSWPLAAWLLAIVGIFVYHALYFVALRLAPPAQANLINYLWPLLIVVFAAVIPGSKSRLGWPQFAGAVLGFAATALLIGGPGPLDARPLVMLGFGAALGCALTWSLYSVLNNRLAAPGSEPMALVCAAVTVLSAISHLIAGERFVVPEGGAVIGLVLGGIGPIGAAFIAWDHATKHGNLALLGAMSYAAPPLSTGLLVLAGAAEPSWLLLAATVLVVAGAALAATPTRIRETAAA